MNTTLFEAPKICTLSTTELTALYRSGDLSPIEVTRVVLQRTQEVQANYNAFSWIDSGKVLEAAKAAEQRWRANAPLSGLDGVPITVKDVLPVLGGVVRYGSRAFAHAFGGQDASAVQRLRNSGAIITAVTTSPEFGWKGVTDSPAFGPTLNPWNPRLTAGGSSGGAAVAAATGAGFAHVGTDGGGSARIPAAFCGIVGFKPTFGQIAMFPPSAFGTLSHIGSMANNVEDVARLFRAMRGRDLRDWSQYGNHNSAEDRGLSGARTKKLRIGYWNKPANGQVHPNVRAVVEGAIRMFGSIGADVEEIVLPLEGIQSVFEHHWFSAAAAKVATVDTRLRDSLDPGLLEIAERGAAMTSNLVVAQWKRAEFGQRMDALLSEYDFLVSPAVGIEPFEAGREFPDTGEFTRWIDWAGFTYPLNLSQQPACVVPCGFTKSNLPVGLQIIGARGADFDVLALARDFEQYIMHAHGIKAA